MGALILKVLNWFLDGFNGLWERLPTGAWRKAIIFALLLNGFGLWCLYDSTRQISAEMVTREAHAAKCVEMEQRTKEALQDFKDAVKSLKHDIDSNRDQIIKTLHELLETQRTRPPQP